MLMLSAGQRDLVRDKGTVLGRALIGLLFVMSGIGMLMDTAGSSGYLTSLGVPLAGLVIWLVIAVKIVAGGAVMLGKKIGAASFTLIVFTAMATLIAHSNWSDPMQLTAALKNLAIIGGLLYLMAYGPGGTNTHKLSQ
jgi:putative oxidoreductase